MKAVFFFCLSLLFPSLYAGNVYYVNSNSVAAFDINSGASNDPWKTLTKAANSLVPGDKVIVYPGTYSGQTFIPLNSGTATNPIIYEALPGTVLNNVPIKIESKQYINLIGFKVQNVPGDAISVISSRHINIKNNITWNSGGSGIAVWGRPWGSDPAECNYDCSSDILVEGNLIQRANNVKIGGGYNEHLTVASGVKNITIRKNELTAGPLPTEGYEAISGGEGIDIKEGVEDAFIYENRIHDMVYCRYGIYIDAGGSTWGYPETYKTVPGTTKNIRVYKNVVERNDGHGIGIISEGSGKLDYVLIYNNIVQLNGNDGILVYDWGLSTKPNRPDPLPWFANVYIFNNTVYKNARIRGWYGGIAIDHKFAKNISIHNNLVFGNPTNIRQYNLPVGDETHIGFNSESTNAVANAEGGNFHLKQGSLCINNGTNVLPLVLDKDFDDNNRPVAGSYDIGAFEYQPILLNAAEPYYQYTYRGTPLTFKYVWVGSPTNKPYKVFVHFTNYGQVIFQDDHFPPISTTEWAGPLSYERTITIPATIQTGDYKIFIGLYYPDTGGRLWLQNGVIVAPDPNESQRYQIGSFFVLN